MTCEHLTDDGFCMAFHGCYCARSEPKFTCPTCGESFDSVGLGMHYECDSGTPDNASYRAPGEEE